MHLSIRTWTFLVVGWLSLNYTFAQTPIGESVETDKEFKVTTSVSIGFSGPSYSTQFQLVDELGLEYDVMSLVADPLIADSIQLTEEQSGQMQAMKQAITQELQTRLAGAITSDTERENIESRFREAENEIRSVMTDDQLDLLEQARIQQGVKRFGLAEFLATKAMRKKFELEAHDVESIKTTYAEANSNHEQQIKLWIEQANQALISELSAPHQSTLHQVLDEKAMQLFFESKLFLDSKTLQNRQPAYYQTLLRQLRLKRLRDDLQLNEAQSEKIQALHKRARTMSEAELKTVVTEILSDDQFEQLSRYVIRMETSKYGTVNELSYGLLSKLMGLTSEESDALFRAGEQVFAELTEDLQQAKLDSLRQSFSSLSAEKRNRVIELVCESGNSPSENLILKTR